MFKVDGEVIEEASIGNNKYQLRSNGVYVYSENLKRWSPYARRELERHWVRIKATSKTAESIGGSAQKKKKK